MGKIIETYLGDWYDFMKPILITQAFNSITEQIKARANAGAVVYPGKGKTFRAFKLCPLESVKVVILGQDPYHDGSATGLAFANREGARPSPSLRNIITCVKNDFGDVDVNVTLEDWAKQGVLLLNTALTVEKGRAGIHTSLWKPFTRMFIQKLSIDKPNLVFVLWGKKAQEYQKFIRGQHTILTAPHPAAESYSGGKAGFFTCGHFKKINETLAEPIQWFAMSEEEKEKWNNYLDDEMKLTV